MEPNNMGKLLELIDLYKYGTITGERTELVVAPLFIDGKYDDSKRVITLGIQGGLARDRDSFIMDAKDFDSKVLPYLISYYEGSDTLELEIIERSTRDNVTSKSIYETEIGNLLYLETLNNSLFDVVASKKSDIDRTIVKPTKDKSEKDWEEILQYAKSNKDLENLYENKFTVEEIILVDKMIEVLSGEDRVNYGNSRRSKEKNQDIILEYLGTSSFSQELKDKIIINSWNLAKHLGLEKRIKIKVDLESEDIQRKLTFALGDLSRSNYFDSRYLRNISEESKVFGKNKEAEINRIKSEFKDKSDICDDLLVFLENTSNRNSVRRTINEVLNMDIDSYENVVKDDYNELNETIDLVIGGKLDSENFEFIVDIDKEGNRVVRISILNGLSRMDSFNFIFTKKDEFDNKLKVILDNLLKIENTKLIDDNSREDNLNQILLRGYPSDFYSRPKVKTKNVRKEINTTAFATLHEYVNNYKIRNDNNILEVFERDSLLPYNTSSEREKLDIEFATYWNVMAGIFESAYDTMLGEKYAFNNLNEKLFYIMNDYFASTTLAGEAPDLKKLKRLFAESKVPHALVIFNRLFKNQYYLDYVTNYYSSIVEEKEFELEEDIEIDLSPLYRLEEEIKKKANSLEDSEDYKVLGDEQAERIVFISGAEDTAQKIINTDIIAGSIVQAKEIKMKDDALEQAEKIVLLSGAEKEAEDLYRKDINSGALMQAEEILTSDLILNGSDEQAKALINKPNEELIRGAEAEARFILDEATLIKLREEILEEARIKYTLEFGAEEQALEINDNDIRNDLIRQIRDGLKEILEAKEVKEKSSFEDVYHDFEEHKELIFAVDDSITFSDKENPATTKVFFDTPETAEVIISIGHVDKEEVLYQKKYSKENIVSLSNYLIEEYAKHNDVNYVKSFKVPNTNKEGLILLGTNENVFQISNAPSEIVEIFKNKFKELGTPEEVVSKYSSK